ncbi:head-tail connector protein [Qingshengfaniella alkalisoli]|uniref:PhiE125 gp8 family phage protein n=1 Tax=Qingshengfaniella alkalisoli TaxID=2599296 RepID=A0A5B8J3Q3_9RHOB|nr:hypothetical protein [Qingshengfaniella alkalisoli]QDY68920.1 hypothetical protein FPZ52_04250 [Qingshengfaniella alkalisoli]
MRLVETTAIQSWDLPVSQFRAHLRLGTGFSEDDLQDAVLDSCLRAAILAIEGRTGKVLLQRGFKWSSDHWHTGHEQPLPVAPVMEITAVKLITRAGDEAVVDPSFYVLVPDTHRPLMRAAHAVLPRIPVSGRAEIGFEAGYSADWDGVPNDLSHAVLLLAAQFYESRITGEPGCDTSVVSHLIERYRTVRILGGASR